MPQAHDCIIKVIGVGGGGSNAVNYMFNQGIKDVSFVVCNTDSQALENSPIPIKVKLGESLTEGRGAGSKPDIGRQSAIESLTDITAVLEKNTKMVFITAGMGGGTGTGAAPIIAKAAKDMGILTVGIVTIPFKFEGKVRINQALDGINEMEKNVDSLLIINNEKLRDMFGDLKLSNAFGRADNVLATAAKGIAEIITVHGYINVDFADVETVMKGSGVAIMGSASADGEKRAIDAIEAALESPLLNNNNINGARNILLNITSGVDEITMDEVGEITDYVQALVGSDASIIWGTGIDESLGSKVNVTIIATGFETNHVLDMVPSKAQPIQRFSLDEEGRVVAVPNQTTEAYSKPPTSYDTGYYEEKSKVIDFGKIEADKNSRYDQYYKPVVPKQEAPNQTGNRRIEIEQPASSNENARPWKARASQDEIDDERFLEQMENIPAYKRKNLGLNNRAPVGSESERISRFSISDDGVNGPKLSKDNPYLHDNVD